MTTRTKKPDTKVRNLVLPVAVDAALVRAAKKEGRSARAHAAKLLAAALGLACWLLVGCSGASTSPLNEPTDAGEDTGKVVTAKHHDPDAGEESDAGGVIDSGRDASSKPDAITVADSGQDVVVDALADVAVDSGPVTIGGPCPTQSSFACSDKEIAECSNGAWQRIQTCQFGCSEGACYGVCSPGDEQCVGLQPQQCSSNFAWENFGPSCQVACVGGGCSG